MLQRALLGLFCGLHAHLGTASDWYPYDVLSWSAGEGAQEVCRKGHMQSPVELPNCQAPLGRPAIDIDFGSHEVELMNNGHTVQLTLHDTNKAVMKVQGATYKLIQCHFHWGSEHTIGGMQQDMVAHCVHLKDAAGREMRFGVLAIFYEIGDTEDPFLSLFENKLPQASSVEGETTFSTFKGPVNFDLAYKGLNLTTYWTYPGSLTTPPCTEAVDWYPLMTKQVMSEAQYSKFKAAIGWKVAGGNYRPPQLLFGRQVVGCLWGPKPNEQPGMYEKLHEWYPYDSRTWADDVGTLSSEVCRRGNMQSPVELPTCDAPASRPVINIDWGRHPIELLNNGHTVQLTLKDDETWPDGFMKVGDATYKLLQCHFHWGSEHTIGNKQQDMVAHCVHVKQAKGREMRFGVLAIFYEVGEEVDPFLASFEDTLPHYSHSASAESHRRLAGKTIANFTGPVDFNLAFSGLDLTHYWTYPGSLTTPPCTEAVDWFPLMHKKVMSKEQYNKFKSAIGWNGAGGNFRPPQLLHGRKIEGCREETVIIHDQETSWEMTGGLVAAIVVIATCACASLVYFMHRAHKKSLAYALPPGLPTDTPIIIKSTTRDGFIDEFEVSGTGQSYERGFDKLKKRPSFVLKETMQGFARQISPSLGRAVDGLKRQISPASAKMPESSTSSDPPSNKAAEASHSRYPAPSPVTEASSEATLPRYEPKIGRPFSETQPTHANAQRAFFDLSCFLPFLCRAKSAPALAPPTRVGRHKDAEFEDVMIGA